jgi:hypothetical protein
MQPEGKPVLKYDNILVSSQGIAEMEGKRILLQVPAADIHRVVLRFGRPEHRPVFSISIGIVLAVIGIVGLVEFFRAMQGYRYELGMIAFGIIGGSMIFDAFKKRLFLEVHAKNGLSRLVLSKNARRNELQEFCSKIQSEYGFPIAEEP